MALLAQPTTVHHGMKDDVSDKARWSLHGHDEEILAVSTRNNVFASSSADGVTLVWRMNDDRTVENVCKVASHGPAVIDTDFVTADTLVCTQGDGCVTLWNLERGAQTESISRGAVRGRNPWPVVNTVTAPSAHLFFFGGDDGYLAQCDRRQGPAQTTWANLKVPITSSCCTDDSLFLGDACGRIHWFDLRMPGTPVDCLDAAKDVITSLCPDSRGERVAALSLDATLRIFDVQPFATSNAERCLATMSVSQDVERRHLLRAGWHWRDDVIAVPAPRGCVHCVSAARSTGEVILSADTTMVEAGNIVNTVAFLSTHHMVVGGTTALVLKEI